MRAAAERTFCTAGSSRPIKMAMMAMTTSNSINVKPEREWRVIIGIPHGRTRKMNEQGRNEIAAISPKGIRSLLNSQRQPDVACAAERRRGIRSDAWEAAVTGTGRRAVTVAPHQ